MWPMDLFRKRRYEVAGYARSGSEALQKARGKLPFPYGSKFYASYEERRPEPMFSFDTDSVSDVEVRIAYTLTRAGKKMVKKDGLEAKLVHVKGT